MKDKYIINNKIEYKIDIPVLLLFFNRPNTFKHVFDQVKIAKPSKLFLYCDGPRNEEDRLKTKQCIEIAENIDWNCEVYRYYQEENKGCDPSEYISQKWAFSIVDKCIILEDDDVPSQSFFPFCKELLDKYENDTRINMICGMNNLNIFENDYDYLFSKKGSTTGWASWKRVIDQWTDTYELIDDKNFIRKLILANNYKTNMKDYLQIIDRHIKSKRAHYETILSYNMFKNNTLNIIPTKNLISNIGNNEEGGTHGVTDLRYLPKSIRSVFCMDAYDYDFPLNHPPYVIEDFEFLIKFNNLMFPNKFIKLSRKIEHYFYLLKYGQFKYIFKKISGK